MTAAALLAAAPLPGWRQLIAGLAAPRLDDAHLALPWRQGEETALWFSRGTWALAVIAGARRALMRGVGPSLWFPDYFCNQATAAVRAAGARLAFYPVTETMAPDWAVCRCMADATPPDVFVMVHFFGLASDTAPAREMCDSAGAWLVEDAAHVLAPAPGIGNAGEFVLYCPHKTLAVPDGAVLIVRTPGIVDAAVEASRALGSAASGPTGWLARRLAQKAMPAAALAAHYRRRVLAFDRDPAPVAMASTPGLSGLARRLLAAAPDEILRARAERLVNARLLAGAVAATRGCGVVGAEGAGDAVPYRLVMRCTDAAAAARYYDALRRRGIPVETWPDLAPEVLAEPIGHAAALALRRTQILIPVHAPLAPAELRAACA